METNRIIQTVQEIQKRCAALWRLRDDLAKEYAEKEKSLNAYNQSLLEKEQSKLKSYIRSECEDTETAMDAILTDLEKIFAKEYGAWKRSFRPDVFSAAEYEGNKARLENLFAVLSVQLGALNAVDFDEADPPRTFVKRTEKIDTEAEVKNMTEEKRERMYHHRQADGGKDENYLREHVYYVMSKTGEAEVRVDDKTPAVKEEKWLKPVGAEEARRVFETVSQIKSCVAAIKTYLLNYLDMEELRRFYARQAQMWLSDEMDFQNVKLKNAIKSRLATPDDKINAEFFEQLKRDGDRHRVDETGMQADDSDFPEEVTLGSVAYKVVSEEKHAEFIDNLDDDTVLRKYTKQGKMLAPFVLNLRENGNVLLNIDEETYSDVTQQFVHEYLLNMILSIPAGRLNIAFIDVDNLGNFNKYAVMKRINDNFILDEIVRDEAKIEGAVKNMEHTMHDINDNKLSFNNKENIFEYNKISASNPQSFHLLVLLNYPKSVTEDVEKRLLKVIHQGNAMGIYTFIVNNLHEKEKNKNCEPFLKEARKHMHEFTVAKGKITLNSPSGNHDYFLADNWHLNQIGAVYEILETKKKQKLNNVIKLEDMFRQTDAQYKAKKVESPEALLSIPVGLRGGELQSLELSSLGDGNAHAVVIGGTGSGKSNLLHAIILDACYKYSPDDFQIFLVDFKGGVEFKYYEANKDVSRQLPHIRLTGLTSEPEDGVAIMRNILDELHRRETVFRKNGVEDIVQFRKKFKEKMPRLLVIIDEVQELFERNESLGMYAINIMSELFKKGRAFGISILWASQNVPKVAGLRDKVLSQIGNKISLRLNIVADAQELDIDPKKVALLNRPEKGLGVIKDSRTGNDCVEFRVAYAESAENRGKYVEKINARWKDVVAAWAQREPLFIVGNDDVPRADEGLTRYVREAGPADVVPKSSGDYVLSLGQNYITGKPYEVRIHLRGTKSNLWFAGADFEELRDLMGFSMLSVLMENLSNSDFKKAPGEVYYVNGELRDPKNPNDLFYVLPSVFEGQVRNVSSATALTDMLLALYRLRRERAENMQAHYPPVFVFINKLQAYADLFKESKLYDTEEGGAEPVESSFGNFRFDLGDLSAKEGKMTFAGLFKEVFGRGSDAGIHFILAMDSPSSVRELEPELKETNKIILKGLRQDDLIQMFGISRMTGNVSKEGLAYCYADNETEPDKFKPYRYDSAIDEGWFRKLAENYKALQ